MGLSSFSVGVITSGAASGGGDVVAMTVAMGGVGVVAEMAGERGGELGRGVEEGESG